MVAFLLVFVGDFKDSGWEGRRRSWILNPECGKAEHLVGKGRAQGFSSGAAGGWRRASWLRWEGGLGAGYG